jgi:uncharacterized SAM-binding protein YcdF (DUF218 family)
MFIMPSSIGLVLITVGVVLLVMRARRGEHWPRLRWPAAVTAAGLLMLYLASTPMVATALARSLERMTPYLKPEDAPEADAIVVPGGGQWRYEAPGGVEHLFSRNVDRLEQGIRAYKAGRAPRIVMGGGGFATPSGSMVGDFLRNEAITRGVPPGAVLACGMALYTTDEGAAIAELLKPFGARRVLLCTSASHMPRARIVYERLGFEVICVPCDFDTRGAAERFSPMMLVPRGLALCQTENCVKEWIGLTLARLKPNP